MSHEYTERVQLISVARMASVANTFPWVLASYGYRRRKLCFSNKNRHSFPFPSQDKECCQTRSLVSSPMLRKLDR